MKKSKWLKISLALCCILFCILWCLKIESNKTQYTYEKIKYEPGEIMSYNGIELAIDKAQLYEVDDFLNYYGQEYAWNYDEETLKYMKGTKVLVCTISVKNVGEEKYSLESLFGAYIRMEHRWISAFDPIISQSLNPVFSRKAYAGKLRPGEQTDLILVTDINHISLTDKTWEHLEDYIYTFCVGEYQDGYYAYELNFRIAEDAIKDD